MIRGVVCAVGAAHAHGPERAHARAVGPAELHARPRRHRHRELVLRHESIRCHHHHHHHHHHQRHHCSHEHAHAYILPRQARSTSCSATRSSRTSGSPPTSSSSARITPPRAHHTGVLYTRHALPEVVLLLWRRMVPLFRVTSDGKSTAELQTFNQCDPVRQQPPPPSWQHQ